MTFQCRDEKGTQEEQPGESLVITEGDDDEPYDPHSHRVTEKPVSYVYFLDK